MAYQSYTYDRAAMISDYELLLRQQAEYIPPFTDKELQRPALMFHYNRAAAAEALEGIKSMRFEMLCDHIASRGIPISGNDSRPQKSAIKSTIRTQQSHRTCGPILVRRNARNTIMLTQSLILHSKALIHLHAFSRRSVLQPLPTPAFNQTYVTASNFCPYHED